jgi:hypothetical protein
MIHADYTVLDRLIAQIPDRLDDHLAEIAATITGETVAAFGTSPPGPSGRSQPGYPPNVDTGALRASIRWRRLGHLHYVVEAGTVYALPLEYGTTTVAPRPFMAPAFASVTWAKKGQ